MTNPRPEKTAVVEEVREKLEAADAVVLTEYRGLKVSELAALRTALRAGGGEYKVYKNTLVRLAARELGLDLDDALTGPTALAFVSTKEDGSSGDIAAVAKAIAEFAKANPLLVVKGGVLGENILDAEGAKALASLPTASEIYARLAGALNFGARNIAGATAGVHRSIAYVLQAAIDKGVFEGGAAAPASDAPAPAEATDAADEAAPEAAEPAAAVEENDAAAEATAEEEN